MLLTIQMILVFVLVFIALLAVEIVIQRIISMWKQNCASNRKSQGCMSVIDRDPLSEMDVASTDLDEALIQIRQAVAQAIATERQLERQLEKNNEQAATWENRAKMAIEQNNQDLADQTYQRQKQYLNAITHLTEELEKSRKSTEPLRQKLTDLEADVHRIKTRSDVLRSRSRNADAYLTFNKHFAALLATYAVAQNKLVEEKLHGIIDEMPAGLMVVKSDGQILAVNPQIETMTGISADEICHKISADTIFMQSDEVTLSSKIKELAGKGIYSTHVRTNNEVWTPADVTISRIKSGDYIICVLDATTRAKL
jgi:PAS domain S-box-containing protein